MPDQEKRIEESEIFRNAPMEEPARQYYFIEQARKLVKKKSEELGRNLSFAVLPSAVR